MLTLSSIKHEAKECGFSLCGVTPVRCWSDNGKYIQTWLTSGQGEMLPYMARNQNLRVDATGLLEGAISAVVCAVNYKSEWSLNPKDDDGRVASYALHGDYHKPLRKKLVSLLSRLQLTTPQLRGRACVDSAPLLEKHYAYQAGLGWIGRQSLLVTPQHGTFVLLAILLLDMEVDSYDTPLEGVGCGECHRCEKVCPTGAITPTLSPYFNTIDSRRCISALTVECDNPHGAELHGWRYGCDECQICCPYNQSTPINS